MASGDTQMATGPLRDDKSSPNKTIVDKEGFQGVIGKSRAMSGILKLIERVADSDSTVLINGETGTGKGLIAKAIHTISYRKNKPFVAINCGAIPENLLESELFGHVKGAFTGATAPKCGKFEVAHGGTLKVATFFGDALEAELAGVATHLGGAAVGVELGLVVGIPDIAEDITGGIGSARVHGSQGSAPL